MTKDEAIGRLRALAASVDEDGTGDPESAHMEADAILLALINDPDVSAAYNSIHPMWYS